ncbi:MAG TPA: prolipoprotein diacylglyceryl transferase family protein [Acidimicrobiia bacterium]|nr:prolipoprotein diacylglyceryl transferase family protein [Acidimicrobiia bacterium]
MEFTLLWAVLTAVATAYLALRLRPIDTPERPLDRIIGAAVVGLFAGRLAALIGAGINPIINPGQLLLVRGGVDTMWASLAATVTLCWPLRNQLPAVDNLAPLVLAALAGWHSGCLWRSGCLGAASDLPWAWSLPGSAVSRHPVELYAALALAAGWLVLSRVRFPPGSAAAIAVVWAATTRLITEPLRPSLDGGPIWFYLASALIGLLAAFALPRRSLTTMKRS